MANYTTSSDLKEAILDSAYEPTDGTSDWDAEALRLLNRAYQTLWSGGNEFAPNVNETWWWLRAEDSLILQPSYTDGTVSVTNDSASITFSSAPSASLEGYHFKVDGHADVFQITSHSGGSASATLDAVYTGDTASSASFKAFKLDYDLANDVLSLFYPMRVHQDERRDIDLITLEDMHYRYPLHEIEHGVPRYFAMVDEATVRFSHYGGDESGELIRVDYSYLQEPADLADDTSEPLVPRRYRYILVDMALYHLYRLKNDDRASMVREEAARGIQAMARENRSRWGRQSRDMGHIFPRPGHQSRHHLRTGSWGLRFT